MTARPTVVVTRRLPAPVEAQLGDLFDARLSRDDRPLDAAALAEAVRTADGLLCTVTDRVTKDVLSTEPRRMRMIANFGVGFNHIDIAAARANDIVVTNTPDVLTDDTADLAITLLLMVARRTGEGERHVRDGAWMGWAPTHMLGTRVTGKTLGIERRDSVEAVLRESDFVSVHCPATPETRHLVNAERLGQMKREAFLINTSRGDVVDEAALVEALCAHTIAGAGLDVFEREPSVTPALLGMDNVVLLPHLGSATMETRVAMGERAIENLVAFFRGETPRDRVT